MPPAQTAPAAPTKTARNVRGTAKASIRRLPACPVCGYEATFRFTALPARGSTLTAVWYYNRRKVGQVAKPQARRVRSFIRWAGPAAPGFYWCDLVV